MFFSPISDLLSVCLVTSILVLFSFFHKLSDDFWVRELVSFKKKKKCLVQFGHFHSYDNILLIDLLPILTSVEPVSS